MAEPYQLVQYVSTSAERPTLGIYSGNAVHVTPSGFPTTLLELCERWDEFDSALHAINPTSLTEVPDYQLRTPITFPRKLICAGANFFSHVQEMGSQPPAPGTPPFFFLKPPSTTAVGPGATSPIPVGESPDFDWEAELAIVIGRAGKAVPPERARTHIAGFMIANDLSARGRFARKESVAPFDWDWLGQKDQDGSCPLGPGLVPAWSVPDIDSSGIRLSVNDEEKQNSSLSDLIVGIDDLVAAASRTITLEPGDVILAGTPAGVGAPRGTFLAPGDRITVSIEGLGVLEHFIGSASEAPWTQDIAYPK